MPMSIWRTQKWYFYQMFRKMAEKNYFLCKIVCFGALLFWWSSFICAWPGPTIFNAWSSPSHALYYYYHNYYSYYPYYLDSGRGHLSGWPFWRCCYLLGETITKFPLAHVSLALSLYLSGARALFDCFQRNMRWALKVCPELSYLKTPQCLTYKISFPLTFNSSCGIFRYFI